VTTGQKQQGGSTLTMQLARGFFLTPEKRIKRKIIEIVITFQLEHRFNKKQIFEMYANEINLGQRGSFSIDGFGEASQAYFGKDVRQLDLAECALLAGIIQRPSYFNPFRHPDRTIERRNLVLDSMVETGAITKDQAERAKAEPLHLTEASVDASEAPYFVDLVHDQLLQKLGERDFNREGLRIYTSLDPDLQREATEAVESTIHVWTSRWTSCTRTQAGRDHYVYPQVALVALNPHTGQVLALVGGRNYGNSQLNHAVAKRPTGSIFKPFVYAGGLSTRRSSKAPCCPGQTKPSRQVTMLSDEQTTYDVGDQEYTPRNYEGEYHDQVTARYALQQSLNNATIGLAVAWWASIAWPRWLATPASRARVERLRWPSAPMTPRRSTWPALTPSSPTTACTSDPWMLASVRTPPATSSPTTRPHPSRCWTRAWPT
jgi:penicillin-binding protein 1B